MYNTVNPQKLYRSQYHDKVLQRDCTSVEAGVDFADSFQSCMSHAGFFFCNLGKGLSDWEN